MQAEDIVFSAYADASPSSTGGIQVQPTGDFAQPPRRVSLPMQPGGKSVAGSFSKTVADVAGYKGEPLSGALAGLLARYAASPSGPLNVRLIGLVTFSAGYGAAKALLTRGQGQYLDAALFVDSLAIDRLPAGNLWVNAEYEAFLRAAALGGPGAPLVVSSAAEIPSASKLVGSTTDSTAWILERARAWRAEAGLLSDPDPFPAATMQRLNAPMAPVTITGGNPSTTQEWPAWPTPRVERVGNIVGLFFEGGGGPAHIFQAWHVQPRLWSAFLAPWWSGECGLDFGGPAPVSSCGPRRVPRYVSGLTLAPRAEARARRRGGIGAKLGAAIAIGVGLVWAANRR